MDEGPGSYPHYGGRGAACRGVRQGYCPAGAGNLRSDGGTYKSLEYVGSTIDALDMSGRYTIANMSLEAGCKTALFAADQKTADYFDLPLEKIS